MFFNVRIVDKATPGEITVECNFIVYRSRLARDEASTLSIRIGYDDVKRGAA